MNAQLQMLKERERCRELRHALDYKADQVVEIALCKQIYVHQMLRLQTPYRQTGWCKFILYNARELCQDVELLQHSSHKIRSKMGSSLQERES